MPSVRIFVFVDSQLKGIIFEHLAAMKPVANIDKLYMPSSQPQ